MFYLSVSVSNIIHTWICWWFRNSTPILFVLSVKSKFLNIFRYFIFMNKLKFNIDSMWVMQTERAGVLV